MIGLAILLVKLTIKLMVWCTVLSVWLVVVLVAIPFMVVAEIRGNQQASRKWQRSMRLRMPRI